MIITHDIDLKILIREGKKFKWDRFNCPKCHSHTWGHGFVPRYISNPSSIQIWLKRYRCPVCVLIIQILPSQFWERFQSSIKTIYDALLYRLQAKVWPKFMPRQRAGHWMRSFTAFCKISGANEIEALLIKSFQSGIRFLPIEACQKN